MSARKNKTSIGVNLTRTLYTHLISTNDRTRRRSFYRIKNSLSFPELCLTGDFLDKNLNERFKEYLFGNPLPKSYADLGNCPFGPISEDLLKEINWNLLSFRKYAGEISRFLTFKNEFENYFLRGKYYDAEKILEKIETTICFSLWSLGARFLLIEFNGNTADNKEFLSKFNTENKALFYTKSLAHYLSLRAERSLSVNRFHADLESALSEIQGPHAQSHREYYLFKLSFLNHLNFKKYKELTAYDFQHSVVDRYLNFRKILISLLNTANGWEEAESSSVRSYLINRINYLSKKINDPLLLKIKLFAGENSFTALDKEDGSAEIEILDLYTAGKYEDAERKLRLLLESKPSQFDLYELYVRTLVYQRRGFIPAGNPKSVQNQILESMFQIIGYEPEYTQAGVNLLRIANNLSNCILSYGILDFVMTQTQGKAERRLMSRLSFNVTNPAVSAVFSAEVTKEQFLNKLADRFKDSLTVKLSNATFHDKEAILNYKSELPDLRYNLQLGRMYQESGRIDDAIVVWEYLMGAYSTTIIAYEQSLINLFKCYQDLKRCDAAVTLFVNSFFNNPLIISKIDVRPLLATIRENRFKNVNPTIDLPLFYTICNADENETHTAFERFNESHGVGKPSELLDRLEIKEGSKEFFYLKYTSGPEILKHSIHITGSKERLEERLKIVQYLRGRDVTDKDFYDDEIKYISNILVIQKGLMELDESKIYVNEQGIIANELKEYDAIYQRFKAIGKVAEKSEVWMLDKSGRLTTVNYSEDSVESSKPEYSSNPVYEVYRELFDSIREKFLYSKFGIVAYLSTRIRHGVLLGEIRPIFEKYKLITLREGDTANYRRNHHWDNIYRHLPEGALTEIQKHLKEFSYSVDGLIFDLIKKYLQVFDKVKNPDGWFDYDFHGDELFWFSLRALRTKDFSQFAQQVFEILWERTDNNLNRIREKIQEETLQEFNQLFDQLELNISNHLPKSFDQSLINNIKTCSTEIHTTINRISRWFKRSGTTASDFRFRDLIDIVMEYTNKSKNNMVVDLTLDVNYNEKMKGEYLTHFADLFRIFTENILKHADDRAVSIPAKFTTLLTDPNQLVISIENNVTDNKKLDALKNVWRGEQIDVRKLVSEDKSGYHKALKILKSDLKCEENDLTTTISEEEDVFAVTMFIQIKDLIA